MLRIENKTIGYPHRYIVCRTFEICILTRIEMTLQSTPAIWWGKKYLSSYI